MPAYCYFGCVAFISSYKYLRINNSKVLMSTPARYSELKSPLRQLALVLRRATGIIHQKPDLAKRYYLEYANGDAHDTMTQSVLSATLPAFPNDYTMSSDYTMGVSCNAVG